MNDPTAQVMPVVVVLPAEIDVTNSDEVYSSWSRSSRRASTP